MDQPTLFRSDIDRINPVRERPWQQRISIMEDRVLALMQQSPGIFRTKKQLAAITGVRSSPQVIGRSIRRFRDEEIAKFGRSHIVADYETSREARYAWFHDFPTTKEKV